MKTLNQIQTVQMIVTLESGLILESDVKTRSEILEGAAEEDVDAEQAFQSMFEVTAQINKLSSLTIWRNGNLVCINPNKVLTIEILTT